MFRHILLSTDGSKSSLDAAAAVSRLANPQDEIQVTVAIVISTLSSEKSDYRSDYLEQHNSWLRTEAQRALDQAVVQLQRPGLVCTTKILEGSPVSAVLAKEAADGQYDLVVMSSRGLGQQHDRLRYLGSVTEHVLRRVSVPVLVVPVEGDED